MAWDTEMVTIVRYIISDFDEEEYQYSDSRLCKALLVSAQLMRMDEDFDDEYSIDIDSSMIDPDPTDAPRDEAFVTLVCLRTACLILAGEIRKHSCSAMSIKDGPSAIDLRDVPKNLSILYKEVCGKYEKALYDHKTGQVPVGHAVLSPYNAGYAGYRSNDSRSDQNTFN